MTRKRGWNHEDLCNAVMCSSSYRQVIAKLGLVEAGGNYSQIKKYIREYNISTSHFSGMGWSRGMKFANRIPFQSLESILVKNSFFQSFKLKKRLFKEGVKQQKCEKCGWCEMSLDGRIPLELDHVNGDKYDNRLENLRVLCPNCHSLEPTHRGLNKHKRLPRW